MNRASGVYRITNVVTGKHYIGSSVNIQKRWGQHSSELRAGSHHSDKLKKSWAKHGADKFEFSAILMCKPEDLLMYEQICIDFYDAARYGYNMLATAGSNLGQRRSDEFRARMSEIVKRSPFAKWLHSPEAREKANIANTGKKRSPETCAKIAAAAAKNSQDHLRTKDVIARRAASAIGSKRSDETRAKISSALKKAMTPERRAALSAANIGKKHTPESNKKNSDAHKGKMLSASHKAKIAAANTGRKPTDATRAKISASKQNVSIETRLKISSSKFGSSHSEEAKAKMSASKKAISQKTSEQMKAIWAARRAQKEASNGP